MTVAFDQDLGTKTEPSGASSSTKATTQNAAVGSRIFLWCSMFDTHTILSVSGGGLTWVKDKTINYGAASIDLWSADCPAGLASGTNVTVTPSGTDYMNWGMFSATGIEAGASDYLDGTPATLAGGFDPAWETADLVTSDAGSLLVAVCAIDRGTPTHTPGNYDGSHAWTEIQDLTMLGTGGTSMYAIPAATGTFKGRGTWSDGVGPSVVAIIAAYLPGGGPTYDETPSGGSTVTGACTDYFSQIIRPSADVAAGSWAASTGSSLYAMVDEVTANDADYIQSSASPGSPDLTKLRLPASPTGVPPEPRGDGTHRLNYRYQKDSAGGDRIDLTVRLYRANGTTVVAEQSHADIGSSVVAGTLVLTGTEADSIPDGDYATGLVLGFEAVKV